MDCTPLVGSTSIVGAKGSQFMDRCLPQSAVSTSGLLLLMSKWAHGAAAQRGGLFVR